LSFRERDAKAFRVSAPDDLDSFTLVPVASGAMSLRSLQHGETFHPVVGPMTEARELHIRQTRLVEHAAKTDHLIIWDVGLGAAANAIAVLEALAATSCRIELHSFDHTLAPLHFAVKNADSLRYPLPWLEALRSILETSRATIGNISWFFHPGDFRAILAAPPAPAPHAILYDPYSPAANPDMWSLDHFRTLRQLLTEPCLLTSYSRSTAVRVTLALAGFHVGQGTATGEKDQTTVAATHRELLAAPLGSEWLARVRRSTRAAPLREGENAGPISEADFTALAALLVS
jgi:hypothetical protein